MTPRNEQYERWIAQKILAARQTTTIGEAGKTGTWRTIRPVLIPEKCLVVKSGKPTCHKCWLYCPEATVSRSIPPVFDYDYCKGCGICATECPTEAIQMVPEKEAPSCAETIANAGGNADA